MAFKQKIFKKKIWITQIEMFVQNLHIYTERLKHQIGPDNFLIKEMLGQGAYGSVYLVQKKGEQTHYAMKVMDKQHFKKKNIMRYARTERNVLKIMNHPFIVKLNYAFQTANKLYLVMDYCPGGDLSNLIESRVIRRPGAF